MSIEKCVALLLALASVHAAAGPAEPVLVRTFAKPVVPVPPFPGGRFEPRENETLSWIGGTDIANLDRDGRLEAALQIAFPELGLRWRNLAWSGDTVALQARPLHYYTKTGDTQPGSIPDMRRRTEPGIVFIAFGKMESMEGEAGLDRFREAYARLLDDLLPLTPRIILIGPTPFFASGPAAREAETRNETLAEYAKAIADLARARGLLWIDSGSASWSPDHSDNGVHLNASGQELFARLVLSGLGVSREVETTPSLREAIAHKNLLWQQYYRPSNWAFLFGDRQHVPASRDVEKREERWMVREIESIPPLIADAEKQIAGYAKEAAR